MGVNNEETVKTIYSPSPSRYVEPKTAAFTGFTSTGGDSSNSSQFNVSGTWDKGWNFYTNGWKTGGIIFFTALGFRDTYGDRPTGKGLLYGYGEGAYYWLIGAVNTQRGLNFAGGNKNIYTRLESMRSRGFPCRSVRE